MRNFERRCFSLVYGLVETRNYDPESTDLFRCISMFRYMIPSLMKRKPIDEKKKKKKPRE